MNCFLLLAACSAVVAPALGKTFTFRNNRDSTLWVGALGNANLPAPENGGFALNRGSDVTVTTADNWGGRFWARTGCSFNGNDGHCETGDCGNVLACNGATGVPPVTLAEFTLGANGGDFYDVSFVDGFNVPVLIEPANQAPDPNNRFRCGVAGCSNDLNANCPSELQQTSGGQVVACKSACLAFDTDQYCCRNAYDTSDTCQPNTWPRNYAADFKTPCPNAYSYAFDDRTSTYTCSDTGYTITFG